MSIAISWLFLSYFAVLMFERLQSLVRVFMVDFFATGFDAFVNVIAVLSIISAIVLLITKNKYFWKSLFKNDVLPDYRWLSITSGVILVSGMVHTEFTVPVIQFISYGFLILAIILRTVQTVKGRKAPIKWWYSVIYVIAFSMAIPVMYPTGIDQAILFYIIEAVVALSLVTCFTLKLIHIMNGNAEDLLWFIPLLIVAAGDSLIVAMPWAEGINTFVLIFGSLSVVLFLIGKLLFKIIKE